MESKWRGSLIVNSSRSGYASPSIERKEERRKVTPTQFWRFFREDEFEENSIIVASGNFSQVKKAKFKEASYLQKKNKPTTYAGQYVALKDPKGILHDFVAEEYALSHEVSCTVILHPAIVNYIGGLRLGKGIPNDAWRVGIVMEYVDINLRNAIETNPSLREFSAQLKIARQIASGMNFLHSLNPHIVHRDLRAPNILINSSSDLNCKIADFGISNNMGYKEMQSTAMYTSLVPPECRRKPNYTTKGDVYFYGWVLVELAMGKQPDLYDFSVTRLYLDQRFQEEKERKFKELIFTCLFEDPQRRPSFREIQKQLNYLSDVKYDPEIIIQTNDLDTLKDAVGAGIFTPETKDSLGRTLVHQACLYGSLQCLEFLVNQWGVSQLFVSDNFKSGCTHFAGRNGCLNILSYLHSKGAISNEKESRFQTTGLDLAIAMKHWPCTDILISCATQDTLDAALQSCSQEGNLDLVTKLVQQGANLECRAIDNRASPLDRAAFNGHLPVVEYLLNQGAEVDQTRNDGSTPLWNASQNGHTDVIALLMENGADVNKARSYDGTSPVYMAALKGHAETVEFLLKHGANPNIARTDTGSTPLFFAAQKGFLSVVKLLLDYDANPNVVRTHDGATPIFMASQYGHIDIVKILIERGVNLNHKNDYGKTALDVTKDPIIKQLISEASK